MPLPPLESVKLFARGGASAQEAANSLEAFELALRLGATGLQGDVWATADGTAVLSAGGRIGSRLRRRRVSEMTTTDAAEKVLLVDALVDRVQGVHELMLDLGDPAALESLIDSVIRAAVADRVWLSSTDPDLLLETKERVPALRTVHVTRLDAMPRGPERHAADLRRLGVDAVSLPFDEWSGGHIALFHRFTRTAIARGPVHERQMEELLTMGVDAMISDHVDRMVDSVHHNVTRP